ncbi:MAG: pilus assembly protein PilM [Patescibacteria group bacterium]|nr:pilus assembly protein PilM [Patescibacteria group bacterium]MDE1944126.1 pilus assembly protein PilM [Patescibacteria group bacterium]MDE1944747.1 pilus assembly protein PilM [Patescibacteria group bacterium]MDE2058070.1 pilus assembly protein PilM [Patescibacteria group bacterium]
MSALMSRFVHALPPPRYLAPPLAGIDISASGVKGVRLRDTARGLVLDSWAAEYLSPGAFAGGDFAEAETIASAIAKVAGTLGVSSVSAALPEAKSYLFEAVVAGETSDELRTAVGERLTELVPLPPEETLFDIVATGASEQGIRVAGTGFAKRIADRELATYDLARVGVRSLEGETSAMARALLAPGDDAAILVIDLGKTTTKLAIVEARIPRFTTTIGIGGHAFTLAVQKHFGVTEVEARRVKIEHGIVAAPGNEDYLAAMLSTVAAIKDEVARRLEYWQEREAKLAGHGPVARAVIAGGNASVRGLPEYLEAALRIPVALGDVFTNFASRDHWIPELDYAESLAYATAIGLALHDYAPR